MEEPDPELTAEQIELAKKLSPQDLKQIDNLLISEACKHWRKVARIVGFTMSKIPERIYGLPDVFYSQRVKELVKQGKLESAGNLDYMRYSEVKLPNEQK